MINKAIFRAYDIRGNSLSDVTPINAYKIGFCFSKITTYGSNNLICVGRDGRLSSDALYHGLVSGLQAGGASVMSIGVVPTPVLYFADKKFNPAGSIMITGSHNQKDDNGFKVLSRGGGFFGEQIQSLYQLIIDTFPDDHTVTCPLSKLLDQVNNKDLNNTYIDEILRNALIDSKLTIAWDPGNGAACLITKLLQQRLINQNIIINSDIDGNFPNHHPDPTVANNLEQLIDIVKAKNCDFGIAFDGDADRIGIVDSTGRILWGDQILCLFIEDVLMNNPSATIIVDVKASQVVIDQIKHFGGTPVMCKTGHSFIKAKMYDTGALLAGEMSGHIFFADKYYGYDDAIYTAIRLIDLCSRYNKSVHAMFNNIPKVYSTPEIRITVDEAKKIEIIATIKNKLISHSVQFNDIDGIRVNTDNGWWLIRSSNTEPAMIIRCESSSKEGLQKLISYVSELLLGIGVHLQNHEVCKN